jgi:hypothetical protein
LVALGFPAKLPNAASYAYARNETNAYVPTIFVARLTNITDLGGCGFSLPLFILCGDDKGTFGFASFAFPALPLSAFSSFSSFSSSSPSSDVEEDDFDEQHFTPLPETETPRVELPLPLAFVAFKALTVLLAPFLFEKE